MESWRGCLPTEVGLGSSRSEVLEDSFNTLLATWRPNALEKPSHCVPHLLLLLRSRLRFSGLGEGRRQQLPLLILVLFLIRCLSCAPVLLGSLPKAL